MNTRLTITSAVVVTMVFAAVAARSGPDVALAPVRALLARAEAALQKNDVGGAVAALDEASAVLRPRAPLVLEKAIVVREPPKGLGFYEPTIAGRVDGRTVLVYLEVKNASHAPVPDGLFSVALDVKGRFRLADGEDIGEKPLGSHRYFTRTPTSTIAFGVDFSLSDKVPKGGYVVNVTVLDAATGRSASQDVPFVLH